MAEKYPNMSPYTYCLNNPLSFIDPDGRDVILIVWATQKGGRTAEKEQLKQLRTEIALEIPNLRRDLKDLWIAGELSLIGTMYKSLMTESEKLMTALETNLTKNGINVQDYLDKMDRNITLQ